ncbi:MAG: hypothetical protein WCG87_11825 [Bacteroidota bacterium]
MKKNPLSFRRVLAGIITITIITCLVITAPSYAQSGNSKLAEKSYVKTKDQQANQQESNQLVQRMIADNIVDQVKGFIVEKRNNKLYINGLEQPLAIANKYLPMTKQETIKVQVFSLSERQRQHPNADFLQILVPVTFSSGCVDYDTKKPGC